MLQGFTVAWDKLDGKSAQEGAPVSCDLWLRFDTILICKTQDGNLALQIRKIGFLRLGLKAFLLPGFHETVNRL